MYHRVVPTTTLPLPPHTSITAADNHHTVKVAQESVQVSYADISTSMYIYYNHRPPPQSASAAFAPVAAWKAPPVQVAEDNTIKCASGLSALVAECKSSTSTRHLASWPLHLALVVFCLLSTGTNIPLAQVVGVTSCNLRWWCFFNQPLVQIDHLHTWWYHPLQLVSMVLFHPGNGAKLALALRQLALCGGGIYIYTVCCQ